MRRPLACLALLAAAVGVPAGRAAAQETEPDQIFPKSGPAVECQIDEITFREVRYRYLKAPGVQKMALNKVERWEYGDRPKFFADAEDKMKDGDLATAEALFAKAANAGSTSERKWMRPDSLFHRAECLRLMGRIGDAADAYKTLLKEYPEWWAFPRANIGLGRCYLVQAQYDKALTCFDAVAGNAEFTERDRMDAESGKARVLEARGKYQEARDAYEALERKAESREAETAAMAKVRKWLCAVQLANAAKSGDAFEDARRSLQGIVEDTKLAEQRSVLAAAWVGIGECYYYRPKPDKKEALLAFLRVPVIYDDQLDEMPKALFHAAAAYAQIADGEGSPEAVKEAKKRAGSLWTTLTKDFGGSFWAKKQKPF